MILIGITMNLFRLTGDICHLIAIVLLIINIHRKASCTGISGKSQALFALVFTTRYVDLMTNFISVYNTSFKVFYIVASYYTLYLIFLRYKDTYENKSDAFRFEFLILIAGLLSFLYNYEFTPMEVLWTFSIYLEAIAIIPQLYMFHNTKDVSMFPSLYVFALGLYRVFYIMNWVWRYYADSHLDPISVGGGVIQTLLYLDFFYMYIMNKNNIRDMDQLKTVLI